MKQAERRVGYLLLGLGVAIILLGFALTAWEYYIIMTDPRYMIVYPYPYLPTLFVKLAVILTMILSGTLICKRGVPLIISSARQNENS